MKVLVFGQTGQVATELQRRCPPGWQMMGLDRRAADLSDPKACAAVIRDHDADAVINAAAYTAVDRAEEDVALAARINGDAPTAMAQAAAQKQIPFLHISTDYVFDGSGETARAPGDPIGPLGVYGRSKLAGEDGVRGAGGCHAILRTSWVFSAHGSNFVKTMLRLGATRDALNIVNDQIGGPTAAGDIADALIVMARALIADPGKSGTYHFAGAPDTSWECFARETFDQAGLAVPVTGIPTSDFPTPARRPLNSRLDCSETEMVFGISRPDWRISLTNVLKEISESAT